MACATASPTQSRTFENSHHYRSQNNLSHSPVYNNINPSNLSKTQSFTENLNSLDSEQQMGLQITDLNTDNIQLNSFVLRETQLLDNQLNNLKYPDTKLNNDLTFHEKENSLLSASRLRLLQDTTMIESALDLDSLDDSSLGTSTQTGLLKVII